MQKDIDEHKFNDDLLANEGDRAKIRELYPTLEHVLYHKELIDYFKGFNDRANVAKKKSRLLGKWAIILGAISISLAAAEIVVERVSLVEFENLPLPLAIGGVAAICGLSSVAIGAFGVLFGSRKREWLCNRFMGERIRQFHFQSLIARVDEILTSVGSEAGESKEVSEVDKAKALKARFESGRHQVLTEFQHQFDGKIDSKFNGVIGLSGEAEFWLHKSQKLPAVAEARPELGDLLIAYRELRIKHQLGYADYKLQSDHKMFSAMPRTQAKVLESISMAGIAWLFLIHGSVIVIVLFVLLAFLVGHPVTHAAGVVTGIFSVAIIAIAVVALSARAFEQGLQPEREIERYQQYRSAVQAVLEQFDDADSPAQKLRIMRRMERLVFDEMRNFLLTNNRSSFVM
jgi:hypothetical protein